VDLTTAEHVEEYACVVWNADDLVEVRTIRPNREGGGPSFFWRADDVRQHADELVKLNEGPQRLGVYAGPLPRWAEGGTTDKDCIDGMVIWADLEETDGRTAWKAAAAAGLPSPSMVVNSGHGVHLFWRLTDPTSPELISGLVHDQAVLLNADLGVSNPSRVLRLPGFTNYKEPVAHSALVYADATRQYAFAQLRDIVSRVTSTDAPKSTAVPVIPTSDMIERARDYVRRCDGS
jgi:hypothetical protein